VGLVVNREPIVIEIVNRPLAAQESVPARLRINDPAINPCGASEFCKGLSNQEETPMNSATVTLLQLLVIGVAAGHPPQNVSVADQSKKPVQAISYRVGGGATKVTLIGTGAVPEAYGEVKVDAKKEATYVEAEVESLAQPTKFGAEFLTYVLWAVSPEGSTYNLGEVRINNAWEGKLKTSTPLQAFSLFVTAEPYFAVHQPSEILVLKNEIRKDTKGEVLPVHEYKLMARAQYQQLGNPLALSVDLKRVPLEMYEARNAAEIAKSRGAERYAPDIFASMNASLKKAEDALAQKAGNGEIVSAARQAVQFAEDARVLAVQRQQEEHIAQERQSAAAEAKAEAEAKAAADAAEAKRRADGEARRQAELAANREATMKAEAVLAAAKAKMEADAQVEKAKTEADALAKAKGNAEALAARTKAEADVREAKANAEAAALKAKEHAAQVQAEKARQAAEALRAQLLEQFNRILDTRDTPRGLVVNMADVLFDTARFDLRRTAREKLARFSGIVLAHPGLNLSIEGHTDSIGSDEFNQKLSKQRAESVRTYLIKQGLQDSSLTATGFGKSMPIAANNTAKGRQQNRRVEIIISGEVIGRKIGK
jgi:outer membrane protein OmpA-like peptidoglycan-associated protein